jgi:hypothetical protein
LRFSARRSSRRFAIRDSEIRKLGLRILSHDRLGCGGRTISRLFRRGYIERR